MSRLFLLAGLSVALAACSPSQPLEAGDARPVVSVTNDNLEAYEFFADGVRLGRVGAKSRRQFSMIGLAPGAFVTFSARGQTGNGVSWNPISVENGQTVNLTITYRTPR